jgi:hypothetical protein
MIPNHYPIGSLLTNPFFLQSADFAANTGFQNAFPVPC